MSRRPDYRIAALNKDNEDSDNIGVAWKNEDGTITIVFNPFLVVPVGRKMLITMFPTDYKFTPVKPDKGKRLPSNNEIPF